MVFSGFAMVLRVNISSKISVSGEKKGKVEAIQWLSAVVSINGPVTLLLFFTEIKSIYTAQPSHVCSNTKQPISAAGFADAFSSCTIKSSLWYTFLQETGSL